jgi:hypothetical protein
MRDMPLQFAVIDQRRDGRFGREVALAIDERTDRRGAAQDGWWRDQVADTKAGRQDLGESADIHHHAVAIGARQRQDGTTVVVKLMIVVVFDDRDLFSAGKRKERQATRRLQADRRRILVMWCDIHRP